MAAAGRLLCVVRMIRPRITRQAARFIGLVLTLPIAARSIRAQDTQPNMEPILQHIQIPFFQPYDPATLKIAPPKTISLTRSERRRLILLSTLVYGAAFLDMRESVSHRPNFQERDPLARPFINLPAPACYASGAAISTGVNWLSWKMARSERWHRVWWLPQAISVFGNSFGYGYTVKQFAQPPIGRRRVRR